jgi:Arylsulfotransferase (ASST)
MANPLPRAAARARPRVRHALALSAAICVALSACRDAPSAVHSPPIAGQSTASNVTVSANPYNVLSAVITFDPGNTDSARVVYTATAGGDAGSTPMQAVSGSSARIVTLGLLPQTTYVNVLQLFGAGGVMSADTINYTTAALPAHVAEATLTLVTGHPGAGYYLVSPIEPTTDTAMVVAFDSLARIRWYRMFFNQSSQGESKQQPTGHFTINVGDDETGSDAIRYIEFLPSGDSVTTYYADAPNGGDSHELWLTGSVNTPTVHLFGQIDSTASLAPVGGPSSGLLEGHLLLRQTNTGSLLFSWDAWAHYSIADWIEPTGVNPPNDFDHPNAIDFDLDGNYIVSFRHMGAILKIDYNTGAIIYQLGGRLNQFTILNDPLMYFSGQHCVRVLANGDLLMYDNGLRHVPQHTRAVEYKLNVAARTATMVWEYEPSPPVFTPIVGSVERYTSGPRAGNTLVGFAFIGQVDEVDPSASLVWRGQFSLGGNPETYRIERIPSLYQYQKP